MKGSKYHLLILFSTIRKMDTYIILEEKKRVRQDITQNSNIRVGKPQRPVPERVHETYMKSVFFFRAKGSP